MVRGLGKPAGIDERVRPAKAASEVWFYEA